MFPKKSGGISENSILISSLFRNSPKSVKSLLRFCSLFPDQTEPERDSIVILESEELKDCSSAVTLTSLSLSPLPEGEDDEPPVQ